MHCPTVKVKCEPSPENPAGYIVINESDLTDEHELHTDVPPAPPADNQKRTRADRKAVAADDAQTPAPAADNQNGDQ